MRRVIAATALLLFSAAAPAAVPTTESVDTLLAITKVEATVDTLFKNMEGLMQQSMNKAVSDYPQSAETQRVREAMGAKVIAILRDDLSWPKLQAMYEQVYAETFTQDEIDGLITFYRTPVGVAYVDKLPILMQKNMAQTQAMMGPMMQKLQAAMKESIDEAKAAPAR